MARKKTTVYIEEDLLRAAKVSAARTDKKEYEVFEEALKTYLGFDVLERIHERLEREGLALSEEESMKLAYDELHAMRAEDRERERSATG